MSDLLVLDTGVLIGGFQPEGRVAATALSFGELEFGVSAAAARGDVLETRVRSTRLALLRTRFREGLPFDAAAAIAYGAVTAAVLGIGRSPRGRATDLWIAAIAVSRGAGLLTTQPDEFTGLEGILNVRAAEL